MGTNFTGITFDDCNVSPSDDGIINRTILPDGILSGCEISYSGSTLTMAAGTLIACGRQFRHPAAQNWAVVDATTGYARLLITLDLTRSATDQTFDQVVDAVEYANDISGFPALVQQDLNAAGTKYQVVACVISLGTGGISGIINTMPAVHPASTDGGTLTVTAPAGSTVTVSKDGKTLTRVAGADGIVIFRGLASGTWTLTITNGSETASKTVEIVADYATSITFFAATINVTYPAGSVCTATDGTTTLTAPNTSGKWACVVPNAGTWTVAIESLGRSVDVVITDNGQSESVSLVYVFLYDKGDQCTGLTGNWKFQQANDAFGASGTGKANSDNLSISTPSNNTVAGAWRTNNKIDLTNYRTLHVTFSEIKTDTTFSSMCISVKQTLNTADNPTTNMLVAEPLTSLLDTNHYPKFTAPYTAVLDVSALSGDYYIIWGVSKSNSRMAVSTTRVTEVYLS